MRIRKSVCFLAAVVLLMTFALCAGAEAIAVEDDSMFEQLMGVPFRGSSLNGGDVRMRVIDGLIGETAYASDGVQWTVRFTRNQGYASASNLTGIPEDEMSGALDLGANGLKMRQALFRGVDIYTWMIGKNFYCLTVSGPYGNEQLNTQLSRVMDACR